MQVYCLLVLGHDVTLSLFQFVDLLVAGEQVFFQRVYLFLHFPVLVVQFLDLPDLLDQFDTVFLLLSLDVVDLFLLTSRHLAQVGILLLQQETLFLDLLLLLQLVLYLFGQQGGVIEQVHVKGLPGGTGERGHAALGQVLNFLEVVLDHGLL